MAFFKRTHPASPPRSPTHALASFHRATRWAKHSRRETLPEHERSSGNREARQIRRQFASGQLHAAWQRRLQLGSGVVYDGVADEDALWMNAAPPIAALRLGFKDHIFVPMCCGLVEQYHDSRDAGQSASVEEFKDRFFDGS